MSFSVFLDQLYCSILLYIYFFPICFFFCLFSYLVCVSVWFIIVVDEERKEEVASKRENALPAQYHNEFVYLSNNTLHNMMLNNLYAVSAVTVIHAVV